MFKRGYDTANQTKKKNFVQNQLIKNKNPSVFNNLNSSGLGLEENCFNEMAKT